MFPQARYVVNRRDHGQAASSGFWQRLGTEAARVAMTRVEEIQDYLLQTRPERTIATHFDQLTSEDPTVVDDVLRSLAAHAIGRCDDGILSVDGRATSRTSPVRAQPSARSR